MAHEIKLALCLGHIHSVSVHHLPVVECLLLYSLVPQKSSQQTTKDILMPLILSNLIHHIKYHNSYIDINVIKHQRINKAYTITCHIIYVLYLNDVMVDNLCPYVGLPIHLGIGEC